jgi:importin subunit beta-1
VASDLNIMRAGANAIAQIAAIEIPRGEWLEIVNTLAENSQHEDYNIRRASITTLGYICQELKAVNADINSLSCEQILGCLLLGASEPGVEIVDISLSALRDSIPFLKNILENQTFCNKTVEILFSMLENVDYRTKVYEILFEYGKYCYHLLDNYVNAIIQFTVAHIQERSDNSILAL